MTQTSLKNFVDKVKTKVQQIDFDKIKSRIKKIKLPKFSIVTSARVFGYVYALCSLIGMLFAFLMGAKAAYGGEMYFISGIGILFLGSIVFFVIMLLAEITENTSTKSRAKDTITTETPTEPLPLAINEVEPA